MPSQRATQEKDATRGEARSGASSRTPAFPELQHHLAGDGPLEPQISLRPEAATWLHSLLSDEERASVLDRLDHYPGKGSKLVEGLSDEARLQAIAEIVKETSARKAPGRSRIPLAVGVASSISDAKIKAAQALTLLAIPSLTEDELTSISALDLDGATNGSLPIWTIVKNARLKSKSP